MVINPISTVISAPPELPSIIPLNTHYEAPQGHKGSMEGYWGGGGLVDPDITLWTPGF